jgi:hypothetical protein
MVKKWKEIVLLLDPVEAVLPNARNRYLGITTFVLRLPWGMAELRKQD